MYCKFCLTRQNSQNSQYYTMYGTTKSKFENSIALNLRFSRGNPFWEHLVGPRMITGDPAAVPDRAAPGITRVTPAVSEPG